MNSIDQLRVLVGLSGEDELRIAHRREELLERLVLWQPEYAAWLQEHSRWPDTHSSPFTEGYLESFVSGVYDDEFFAAQYQQALLWLQRKLDSGHNIAALSRLRQFFVGLSESWNEPELARSLCRVVDVAQSIQAMVTHLSHTLERLRKIAEQEIQRIHHRCETVANIKDNGIIQAYTDHFTWKVRAYSLALGDTIDPHEVPLDCHECALGRWLDGGGWNQIAEVERSGLSAAHERLHNLMAVVLGEAHKKRPHYIVQYLSDVEAASEEIADILGHCIENEMRKIAILDSLTGLGNRRLFEQELARRLALCLRGGSGFGLLFMDLDRFKLVNDNHGHRMGDEVLRLVAQTLKDSLRGSDAVYRWGGEEFAALVHATDETELQQSAERLREAVENLKSDTEHPAAGITISIGGALSGANCANNTEILFSQTDDNLNQAKDLGRNRVVIS